MVEITIIIEGGVVNTNAVDVLTVNNSLALRQSLHRIFSLLLNTEVSIIVEIGGGYRNAAKKFVGSRGKTYLYIDLDDAKANISAWFTRMVTENQNQPIIVPDKKKADVFFMIQEMEAWILKQPQAIERWSTFNAYQRLNEKESVESHSLIAGKDVEGIRKPSEKLRDIIKHFYKDSNRNKKVQYGKLKNAPSLLDHIDVAQLVNNDSELQRFRQAIITNKLHIP